MASGRRHRAGMDAGWQVDNVFIDPCYRVTQQRPQVLDSSRRWGCRRADGLTAGISGKNISRRLTPGLSHEQLLGRRAAELSRRAESANLDSRSEDLRSDVSTLDRLEGHRSRLVR